MAAFVLAGDGLHVFASAAAAAGRLEAVDVVDGEYPAAWLHDGTVLRVLAPDGDDGAVVLERTGEEDLAGLRAAVSAHARAAGRPEPTDLLSYADGVVREEEHRWPRRPRWLARRPPRRAGRD